MCHCCYDVIFMYIKLFIYHTCCCCNNPCDELFAVPYVVARAIVVTIIFINACILHTRSCVDVITYDIISAFII